MSFQRSHSEQQNHQSWRNNKQWQQRPRYFSYVPPPQYPRPPPPPPAPPPPPVEISKTTKNKLKRFHFRPPAADFADSNGLLAVPEPEPAPAPVPSVQPALHPVQLPEPAAPPELQPPEKTAIGASTATAIVVTSQDTGTTSMDAPQQEEPAAARPENDKDNSLPSTQPNMLTAPASTASPEFLSIHIKTPSIRFAWQELAGTPDTPKARESLGISPNAHLSWGVEQSRVASPKGHHRHGVKRTRSSSPPSSPSMSKSKKTALDMEKFKEAVRTALANPPPPVRNRLARHHTAQARTMASTVQDGSAPSSEDDARRAASAQDGVSPRRTPGLRRTVSCGNPVPKRRRIDTACTGSPPNRHHHDRAVAFPDPFTTEVAAEPLNMAEQQDRPPRSQAFSPRAAPPPLTTLPITTAAPYRDDDGGNGSDRQGEGMDGLDQAQLEPGTGGRPADSFSDYGDDVFDDDILAELDASLAPTAAAPAPQAPAAITGAAGTSGPQKAVTDDFAEFDDDIFTAAEDLMAANGPEPPQRPAQYSPAKPTGHGKSGAALDDMEDMYGDDFGADFDFDAAEKAATQAVGMAIPWANDASSSIQRKAIQRYLVISVSISLYADGLRGERQEKILVVQGERNSKLRTVHLRGDWVETTASVKSYVHVIGEFDASGACVVDNDHNMLILHPDQLITATVVADAFTCTRRAVLQDRVKATSDPSAALVYGTLLHEVFQEALMANEWGPAFLASAVEKTMTKHMEDLYTIKVDINTAREHLTERTRELRCWSERFISRQPKPDAVVQGRNGEKVTMSIGKLLDIEEHVWSPMYGLKGNIDATVQVTVQSGRDTRTLTVPLELKTGRNVSSNHQAQTVLYNLLLSDRYDIEIACGVLYYMEKSQMMHIPTIRHELRHMIMKRNELACYIRERSVQLPPMKKSQDACGRCYAQASCFVYHKLADDGDGESSGMGDKFEAAVRHLTPQHKAFFLKWEDLLTKEEKEAHRLKRELWTMVSTERERLGRCFANVVLDEHSVLEDKDGGKINRFHYAFRKGEDRPGTATTAISGGKGAGGFSFLDSQLAVGEPIVVSDEEGHFALAIGYVTRVRKQRIEVAVDRRLHNARIRQPGFHRERNQVFAGIMEAGGAGGERGAIKTEAAAQPVVRYRLDKDEFSNGMALVRSNLVRIMAPGEFRAAELRRLVVDLVPPRFKTVATQYVVDDDATLGRLNVDQQRAIEKVMSAEDYALVLGMPGTGKTTTIAHIIRALVRKGKSVLLTSYTHTAVDNILLKLRHGGTPILRLGQAAKVHPEVREFAVLAGEPMGSFDEIHRAWHETPVVATTCLGISHALFNERTFDYCIVDEASQITLPICLGPICLARTFVLVGDHNQLPPLVQNDEARAGGLDVSLFKLLSDTHPGAVVNLEHQYRMCEDIMTLSNTLIYGGRLKCGTEALRFRSLQVPNLAALQQHHGASGCGRQQLQKQQKGGCWLQDLLRPETRVAFVNTDTLDGGGGREEDKGSRIVNVCEARVVTQLVEALVTVGVPASEIGVMTHYRSQLSLLKHQLRGIAGGGGSSAAIEMHTTDRFQGRDKDVIVLSLVRSNEACSIGELLKDWRRINVAFTRAKTKLLVVGSRSTVRGAQADSRPNKVEAPASHMAASAAAIADKERGEQTLARFISLMEERHWIYDLPGDALDSHHFADIPATQGSSLTMGAAVAAATHVLSPKSINTTAAAAAKPERGQPPSSPKAWAPSSAAAEGKENRQPLKRAKISERALTRGKPVLQSILTEMMAGKYKP